MKILLFNLLIFLFSFNSYAETYVCKDVPPLQLNYTFTRADAPLDDSYFVIKTKDYEEVYTLIKETDQLLHLMIDRGNGASFRIINKENLKISSVWLEYNDSSDVTYGDCFIID